ncbi:MAG: hypothetical protein GEU78_09725 [Actinobacteria bacterium]|nr:hypothetical protein [Actinomycetota bacterium]
MAATPMASTSRYFRPGTTVIYWVETISDKSAPTRIELDAGTDLSGEVAEIEGFEVVSETLETPDFGSRFASKIPGMITADDSALLTYADQTSADIRALLSRDDNGFIVIMDEGDVETQLMDVFPVRVSAVPKLRARSDPSQIRVQFTITSEPAENVEIPAAV